MHSVEDPSLNKILHHLKVEEETHNREEENSLLKANIIEAKSDKKNGAQKQYFKKQSQSSQKKFHRWEGEKVMLQLWQKRT